MSDGHFPSGGRGYLLVLPLLVLAGVSVAGAGLVGPGVPEARQALPVYADSDRDGIPDLFDGCPGVPNTGQPDADGDGLIDACDLDPTDAGRPRALAGR